ncbi:MAG: SpoIIE family protein phosphatase [Acidobacteriaceae bacterium]|nr:SpoIIE family protein phosphatase [Acidobacteriaceae bacterium]
MSSSSSLRWVDRSNVRFDREDPYLRIQSVTVFVRDQDRSLSFYRDRLGFRVFQDHRFDPGERWVAVGPPDGTTLLALISPKPDSEGYERIGRSREIVFLTDDVVAKFKAWSERGVCFHHAPVTPAWGGTFTSFEDVDGNQFALVGFDEVSREIEAQRRAIAEELEAERRTAQELEIAKQVQARLFPQRSPAVDTMDYAGLCLQAHQVGGDYYDFLDVGHQRLGAIIGDVSGKGIGAALLMANLQANIRSQPALAFEAPERLLQSVNQLFYQSSSDSAYATLIFAGYDGSTRRLRYANCGHLPALVLRHDGTVELLKSTCTVLGLFREWDCVLEERVLDPGDTLVLYSDGVTESISEAGQEFGEERLLQSALRHREMASDALLRSIVEDVQRFSAPQQHDDITLVVAKCK